MRDSFEISDVWLQSTTKSFSLNSNKHPIPNPWLTRDKFVFIKKWGVFASKRLIMEATGFTAKDDIIDVVDKETKILSTI